MRRRGNIPERSAERYIQCFKQGWDHNRKKCSPKKRRKTIDKAKNRRKIHSTREIGREVDVSHTQVRRILKDAGFKYGHYKKKIIISEDTRVSRLNLASRMTDKESDWAFTVFTDECSFWLTKSKPNRVWSDDHMKKKGLVLMAMGGLRREEPSNSS